MYRPKYFKIAELVNSKLLSEFGEERCWEMLDEELLKIADMIREEYGAIGVNYSGLVDCGLRDWRNPTTGSSTSTHCHGKALDLHILSMEQTADNYNKVRKELLSDARFSRLCFEKNISWLHIDIGNRSYREFDA